MRTTFDAFSDFTIRARDHELGKVKDIYFDDTTWKVRYLVVDTRKWLLGKKVLLAPEAIALLDVETRTVYFDLTREQIEAAPHIDEHVPVSRAHQTSVHDFYGWNYYWITGGVVDFRIPTANYGPIVERAEVPDELARAMKQRLESEPNLVSVKDLKGFGLSPYLEADIENLKQSDAARIGAVHDVVINYVEWTVPYLIVDTGEILPGRKVILPTALLASFDFGSQHISTYARPDIINEVPDFEGVERLDEQCERATLGYYLGRFRAESSQDQTVNRSAEKVSKLSDKIDDKLDENTDHQPSSRTMWREETEDDGFSYTRRY